MSFKLYNQFQCSSLMLPEHRKALAEHRKKATEKQETPCIDEHQFELWECLVQQSYQNGKQVTIRTVHGNKICDTAGVVRELVPNKGLLKLSTETGKKWVEVKRIRSVE
ncbi:MAG: YolD-like family protein [Firmicutes bacterium]|nr:YolD-like family protein [Bacillota bacterium]